MCPNYKNILRNKKYTNVHATNQNKFECPEPIMKNTRTVYPRTNEEQGDKMEQKQSKRHLEYCTRTIARGTLWLSLVVWITTSKGTCDNRSQTLAETLQSLRSFPICKLWYPLASSAYLLTLKPRPVLSRVSKKIKHDDTNTHKECCLEQVCNFRPILRMNANLCTTSA